MKPEEQALVSNELGETELQILLDFFDLELPKLKQKADKQDEITQINQQRGTLLLSMLQRPVESFSKEPIAISFNPIPNSLPPSLVRIDTGFKNDKNFNRISIRAANNDLLDIPISGQEVSRFIMGAAQMEYTDTNLKLRRLVALDILNLNTNPLPLTLTKEYSWGFKIDYSPRGEFCQNCDSAGVEGKVGRAVRFNDNIIMYGLGGARIHSKENDIDSYANLVFDAGTVINLTSTLNMNLGAQYIQSISDEEINFQTEVRQRISKRTDIRTNFISNGDENSVSIGFALYFD